MGFFKNIIQAVFPSPDDDDDELEQEAQQEEKTEVSKEKKKNLSVEEQLRTKPGQKFFQEKRSARDNAPLNQKEKKTISLPLDDKRIGATIFYPTNFDDSQAIADCLRNKKMVILNFEKTDNLLAKRMTDFISGTTYALGGSMKKIGHKILLCAPKNIDIDAESSMYTDKGDEPWKK